MVITARSSNSDNQVHSTQPPQISVVLPSYNSEAHLPKTLGSLCDQDFSGSFEILVVDCSQGDRVKQVVERFRTVRFQHESERFNPGRGRNIGAELASGALLVFVDSDVSLKRDALRQAWEYYQKGNPIFGGALELDRDADPGVASYLEHLFFNHESQAGRPICKRKNLSSALMMFDRALFLKNGGFKDIPRMQDTELTERMSQNGQTLTFCPHVVGYQIQDSPIEKVLRKVLINGKNLYFIRYHNLPSSKKVGLFLLLPAIAGLKTARIIGRHLRYQDLHGKCATVLLTPLLLTSGASWMLGLYQSLIFGGGISTQRE